MGVSVELVQFYSLSMYDANIVFHYSAYLLYLGTPIACYYNFLLLVAGRCFKEGAVSD